MDHRPLQRRDPRVFCKLFSSEVVGQALFGPEFFEFPCGWLHFKQCRIMTSPKIWGATWSNQNCFWKLYCLVSVRFQEAIHHDIPNKRIKICQSDDTQLLSSSIFDLFQGHRLRHFNHVLHAAIAHSHGHSHAGRHGSTKPAGKPKGSEHSGGFHY